MKQVSKEQFYAAIGPQDVTPIPVGSYPYTSEFKAPNGRLAGVAVDRYENPPALWPIVTDYFLTD